MPAENTFNAATASCKAQNMRPLPHPKQAPAAASSQADGNGPVCSKAANVAPAKNSASASSGERHERALGRR